jgi:hypothetical protein
MKQAENKLVDGKKIPVRQGRAHKTSAKKGS